MVLQSGGCHLAVFIQSSLIRRGCGWSGCNSEACVRPAPSCGKRSASVAARGCASIDRRVVDGALGRNQMAIQYIHGWVAVLQLT